MIKRNIGNPPLYDVKEISSVKSLLNNAATEIGDKAAFRYSDNNDIIEITYSQFLADTIALGTALHKLGVCGKHVACIGENSYNWITVFLSVLNSSNVFVPVDKELPQNDIINVVNSSDAEILFYSSKYEDMLTQRADDFKNVKYFIGFDRDTDVGKFLSYNELKENGMYLYADGYNEYLNDNSQSDALKMIVYTSGTTGMSKGVMLSERNILSCVYNGLRLSKLYSNCLAVLPLHHTYASSGLLASLYNHSTVCINTNLKYVIKDFQLFKPDYIYIVPAFAELFEKKILSVAERSGKAALLKNTMNFSSKLKLGKKAKRTLFADIHKIFGGNLKKIICGGAPLRHELGDFFDTIGIDLVNGYGITECSPLVSVNRDTFNDCATVGIPLPCCKLKFENVNDDGYGEILVKGDNVMLGYYKDDTLTSEVLQNGYFNTGDYGKLNENGQLIVKGRSKNLIVLNNGKNVFPEEIENYILNVPYVKEAVVYSVHDKAGNENGLCAEVFLNSDLIRSLKISDVYATIKKDVAKAMAELPSYKQICIFKVRDKEFPKTTTNKIKRNAIVHSN